MDDVESLWEQLKDFDSAIPLEFVKSHYKGGDIMKEMPIILSDWMSNTPLPTAPIEFEWDYSYVAHKDDYNARVIFKDTIPVQDWVRRFGKTKPNGEAETAMFNRIMASIALRIIGLGRDRVAGQSRYDITRGSENEQLSVMKQLLEANHMTQEASLKGVWDTITNAVLAGSHQVPLYRNSESATELYLKSDDWTSTVIVGKVTFYDTGVCVEHNGTTYFMPTLYLEAHDTDYKIEAYLLISLLLHHIGILDHTGSIQKDSDNVPSGNDVDGVSSLESLLHFLINCKVFDSDIARYLDPTDDVVQEDTDKIHFEWTGHILRAGSAAPMVSISDLLLCRENHNGTREIAITDVFKDGRACTSPYARFSAELVLQALQNHPGDYALAMKSEYVLESFIQSALYDTPNLVGLWNQVSDKLPDGSLQVSMTTETLAGVLKLPHVYLCNDKLACLGILTFYNTGVLLAYAGGRKFMPLSVSDQKCIKYQTDAFLSASLLLRYLKIEGEDMTFSGELYPTNLNSGAYDYLAAPNLIRLKYILEHAKLL